MAYNNNIPQASDQLSQSQADLLANFQAIYNLVGVNHVNFNAVGQGKHNFVSMPVQGGNPGTNSTELALYTKTSALTALPEAFFQRESNGSAIEFTSALQAASGWTRLPSNILIKWGVAAANPGANVITYTGNALPGSTFSNVFSVLLTPVNSSSQINFVSSTTTQFTMNSNAGGVINFNYFAIGN